MLSIIITNFISQAVILNHCQINNLESIEQMKNEIKQYLFDNDLEIANLNAQDGLWDSSYTQASICDIPTLLSMSSIEELREWIEDAKDETIEAAKLAA